MDVRFECPNCKQRIAIDDSAAGMQIECPGCHRSVTVPGAAKPVAAAPAVRTLPKLRQEEPAAGAPPEPALPPPAEASSKKKGKGGQYKCNNPRCGAVLSESQLLTQQVAGKFSQVCPKCRMTVTEIAKPPGFFAKMFGKK